jgi:hypothetical protein
MSPRLFQHLLSPSTFAQKWTFTAPDGSPMSYTKTVFFWGDIVLAAFAITLIIEGLVLGFARRRVWITAAFVFTALVTAANLVYVIWMQIGGYGLQLMSAVAVALGVYGCIILKDRMART